MLLLNSLLLQWHRQSKTSMETRWKKRVVQNVAQLLFLRHLQSLLCTIVQKPHVISNRHLTQGTGASGAGLILQRCVVQCSGENRRRGQGKATWSRVGDLIATLMLFFTLCYLSLFLYAFGMSSLHHCHST